MDVTNVFDKALTERFINLLRKTNKTLKDLNRLKSLETNNEIIYCVMNSMRNSILFLNEENMNNPNLIKDIIDANFINYAKNNNLECLKFLYNLGVSSDGLFLALTNVASIENSIPILEFLINNGVSQEAKDQALVNAIKSDNFENIEFLMNSGITQEGKDKALKSTSQAPIKIVEYLVDNGASIHTDDEYLLKWASFFGKLKTVKYLVEHGATVSAENDKALENATTNGYINVIKYLIEHGANVNIYNGYVITSAVKGKAPLDFIKFLVDHGAKVNVDVVKYAEEHGKEYSDVINYLKEVAKMKY